MGILLECGLQFVQQCRTCNSVKSETPFVHRQMELPNTSLQAIELNPCVPDGRYFFATWDVSTSVIGLKHDRTKPNLLKQKGIHAFIVGKGCEGCCVTGNIRYESI